MKLSFSYLNEITGFGEGAGSSGSCVPLNPEDDIWTHRGAKGCWVSGCLWGWSVTEGPLISASYGFLSCWWVLMALTSE